MKVKLAYGKKGLEINIPEGYHTDVVEPRWVKGLENPGESIRQALRSPQRCRPLKDLAHRGSRVGIVFSDITRATHYHLNLPVLLGELGHVDPENILFFCATGTHRPASPAELDHILGRRIASKYRIIQNTPGDDSAFVHIGDTSSGNKIWINRELEACDLKILTGFIEPHFFMGFSGGGKAVMPGMARMDTIRFNHSIRMLENEQARWGITTGNPLWEDMQEAVSFLPGTFLLNITLNRERQITGVFTGDTRTAYMSGCEFVRRTSMVGVDRPYDLVITSNSGYPLDLNIYQSVKGMSAAAQIVKQGGNILIAAECWDGIPGGSDYERILSSAGSNTGLNDYIRKNEHSLQDTWQVFFQVLIQQKAKVYLYSDILDEETVRRALLNPVDDPGLLTEKILREAGKGAPICVLPEGPLTIPYIKPPVPDGTE